MAMLFKELDATTREYMLTAFEEEESGTPYRSAILSPAGLSVFPGLMREAIKSGDETTLAAALDHGAYWLAEDAAGKSVNVHHRSAQLALTEFNTWYVAGLARRLKDEGEAECEVYRAENPKWEHASCSSHEGQRYAIDVVLAGHRADYWFKPTDQEWISIPAGPGCHHTIQRIAS